MDSPITHFNIFNAILGIYVIGYELSICLDWSWMPMNKEDYQLPYQDKWSRVNQYVLIGTNQINIKLKYIKFKQ